MVHEWLFKRTDNSPLIIFRIFLGTLISLECFGAILTGWVKRTLITPSFTFSFIGFEWLQPLPGYGMYYYFTVMGILGICIALGYKYRFSIICFTILWAAVYLMQKTAYNNHYYLLLLVVIFMCFFPANRYASLDSKQHENLRDDSMPGYVKWAFVLQLLIVYTYAAIAKFYGDWLDFSVIAILLKNKASYPLIGQTLQQPWVHSIIGVMGVVFDLLIIPALLWKPTRNWAFSFGLFFHLFNSIVFQIGIFPYLALAFTVFFYPPETIRQLFFKKKKYYSTDTLQVPSYKNWLYLAGGIYFLIQLLLPLRHHFYQDDVLWTEEGHRLSWRMMLRSRSGKAQFSVVNKATGEKTVVSLPAYLTPNQQEKVSCYPDFIWQFAQHLKQEYAKKGVAVAVFTEAAVRINGGPLTPFIDSEVDLANEQWDPFRHHSWILPSK